MLISIETHITWDFPGGSGLPIPLWIRTCICLQVYSLGHSISHTYNTYLIQVFQHICCLIVKMVPTYCGMADLAVWEENVPGTLVDSRTCTSQGDLDLDARGSLDHGCPETCFYCSFCLSANKTCIKMLITTILSI